MLLPSLDNYPYYNGWYLVLLSLYGTCCHFPVTRHQADVNTRDYDKATLLHYASTRGHRQIVEWLLHNGAAITQDCTGSSPLHDAVLAGNVMIVRLLLKNSCDPLIEDKNGFTAAELAKEMGNMECCKAIEAHMGIVSITPIDTLDDDESDLSPFSPRVSSLVGKYSDFESPASPTSPKLHQATQNGYDTEHAEAVSKLTQNSTIPPGLDQNVKHNEVILASIQPMEEPMIENLQPLGSSARPSLQNGNTHHNEFNRMSPTAPPEEDNWPELVDVEQTRKMFESNIVIPPPPPMAPPPPPVCGSIKGTGTWKVILPAPNSNIPSDREKSPNRSVSREQSILRAPPVTEAKYDLIAELKRSNGRASLKRAKPEPEVKLTNEESPNMNGHADRGQVTLRNNQQQKPLKSRMELKEGFQPRKFLEKVPIQDSSGLDIPPWKRQIIARQLAEKAQVEEEERRKKEEEEARFRDLPVWKRALMEKREAQAQAKHKAMEPAVPPVSENGEFIAGEDGMPLAPWQAEMRTKRLNQQILQQQFGT